MAIRVQATLNAKDMLRDLHRVRKEIVPEIAVRALNTTATRAVEGPAIKQISAETGVPGPRVRWRFTAGNVRTNRRRLSLVKARRKDLVAAFFWRTRTTVPAITAAASVRQTRTGVTAGRLRFPGAFIAKANGNGNRQVFKRVGATRYPLKVEVVQLREAGDRALGALVRRSGPFFVREYERLLAVRLRRKR